MSFYNMINKVKPLHVQGEEQKVLSQVHLF